MKVRNILIGGFLIVIFLVGLVSYFCIRASENAMVAAIGRESAIFSDQVLAATDKEMSGRIDNWRSILQSTTVQDDLQASNAEFAKMTNIEAVIDERDKAWRATKKEEMTPFMNSIIGSRTSLELKKTLDFYEKEYGYPVYGEIFITNKYGANLAQTGKTSDYRQNDEEWWINAARDGIFVQEIEYDESAEAYVSAICIRIDNASGDMVGVAKIALDIHEIINGIKEAKKNSQYTSTQFELNDAQRQVIFSTANDAVLVESQLMPLLVSNSTWSTLEVDGKSMLVARGTSHGYRSYGGLEWTLLTSYDQNEILAPVTELKRLVMFVVVILLLVSLAVCLQVSLAVSKPLTEITQALDNVTDGNFDVKLPHSNIEEVKALTSSAEMLIGGFKSKIRK